VKYLALWGDIGGEYASSFTVCQAIVQSKYWAYTTSLEKKNSSGSLEVLEICSRDSTGWLKIS